MGASPNRTGPDLWWDNYCGGVDDDTSTLDGHLFASVHAMTEDDGAEAAVSQGSDRVIPVHEWQLCHIWHVYRRVTVRSKDVVLH